MSGNDIPVKEIGEVFDALSDKLPKLINELTSSFYSEKSGSQMGKAIGSMYKELINAGIPKEDALEMAKDYLNTMKSIISQGNMNFNK